MMVVEGLATSTMTTARQASATSTMNTKSPNGTLGPVMKKEVVTTQQPDGTIVTKTTEMRTVETGEDYMYDESEEFNCAFCWTPVAALRVVQIVVGFIVVGCVIATGFVGPFLGVLGGQIYVLVIACLCIILTFVILFIYLFGIHEGGIGATSWTIIDAIYSICAAVLYFIAGCVEAWYASGTWEQPGVVLPSWWRSTCRQNVSDPAAQVQCIFVPWVIAAGFCFVNVLLYAIGACLACMGKKYL